MKKNVRKLFPNGKKGNGDYVAVAVLFGILLGASLIVEAVNDEFDTAASEFNRDGLKDNVAGNSDTVDVGLFETFLRLAFWDAGNALGLPTWLDAVFTLILIVMIFVLATNFIPFIGN